MTKKVKLINADFLNLTQEDRAIVMARLTPASRHAVRHEMMYQEDADAMAGCMYRRLQGDTLLEIERHNEGLYAQDL